MDVEVRVAYIFSALAEEETFISSFCLQDTYILFVSFHANLRDTIFLLDFAFLFLGCVFLLYMNLHIFYAKILYTQKHMHTLTLTP